MTTDPLNLFHNHPAKDDPRTVDELIMVALATVPDEEEYWDAIFALRFRRTRKVFDRAVALGWSACVRERQTGADALGTDFAEDRPLADAHHAALLAMLAVERDLDVLFSILCSLSHLRRPEAVGPVLAFVDHTEVDIRRGVVHALLTREDERSIAALTLLSRDPEPEIRDWATFGLGSMVEVDTPELRHALVERLEDDDPDTRLEAMAGLARLRDPVVLPSIRAELTTDRAGRMELEVATLFGSAELLPLLIALQGQPDVPVDGLREAIVACTPR